MIRRLATRLRATADEGYALLVVMGVGIVLLSLVATALTVASSGYRKSGTDEDWNAALAAAYGGLEEYRSRLANDSTYVGYGNPASGYTDASDSIVTLPALANAAFGIGAGGTWATVPGSDGQAAYRYEVDNSAYASSGSLKLRVTGRAGTQTRTIVASLRQTGFIDYLYFTDFEVFDPRYSGNPTDCDRYAWATPTRGSGCLSIEFQAADTINGPLHSNDRLRICGGTFNGPVTTSNPSTPIYACGGGTFAAGPPVRSPLVGMPPTNGEMKKETRNDLPEVARPGCLYTGPTTVTFNGDGTMTVISPWTKYTNVSYTSSVASTNSAACGLPGTGGGRLGSAGGATVPVLDENLIYVQNVPTTSTDPNFWPASGSTSRPTNFTKLNSDSTVDLNGDGVDDPHGVPEGWQFNSLRYPSAGEGTPRGTGSSNPAYGWKNGDVFVRGELDGAITVAAENFVYITGNLTYKDPTDDVLGLVGQNAVWVRNPIATSGALLDTTRHRTIHAAILSVNATFTVQNYQHGPNRGTLTVLGAIAQKFRGPVAMGSGGSVSSGYAKNYNYDPRLRNVAPPKFLTPVSTTYDVTQVAGVPAAFTANGAVR